MWLFVPLLACADPADSGAPAPVALTLSPAAVDPLDVGDTTELIARLAYDDGSSEDLGAGASWTSSDPAVAGVSAGLVTALAAGTTEIGAEVDGFGATLTLSVVDPGPWAATVMGDWHRQHEGQGLSYFARVVDEADGAVVACGTQLADDAVWSMSAPGLLLPGHTYHAEAFADVNGDGLADDEGHAYVGDPGEPAEGPQTFEVRHAGTAATWEGVPCGGEPVLDPTSD